MKREYFFSIFGYDFMIEIKSKKYINDIHELCLLAENLDDEFENYRDKLKNTYGYTSDIVSMEGVYRLKSFLKKNKKGN